MIRKREMKIVFLGGEPSSHTSLSPTPKKVDVFSMPKARKT